MRWRALIIGLFLCFCPQPGIHAGQFRRGDANLDGKFDLSDPLAIFEVLFQGAQRWGCDDAMDANDDGSLDISDGIRLLNYLFKGTMPPAAPFPLCGDDATADDLVCLNDRSCGGCLDQDAVNYFLGLLVVPSKPCLLPDKWQVDIGLMALTVCPKADASPCGALGLPGWGVDIQSVSGILDIPGKRIIIHVVGAAADLPIRFTDRVLVQDAVYRPDVTFSGDVVVPLTATTVAANRIRITDVLNPVVQVVPPVPVDPLVQELKVDLIDRANAPCPEKMKNNKDLFVKILLLLLQADLNAIVAQEKPKFIGSELCGP